MQITIQIRDTVFATFGGGVKTNSINKGELVLEIPVSLEERCAKYADEDRAAMYASLFKIPDK